MSDFFALTAHRQQELMSMARHMLNGRQRGREGRLAQLQAAGIPTEPEALRTWLRAAGDGLTGEACVYHACTARIANGVDADLPTLRNWGCRVTRVPLEAEIDQEASDLRRSEVVWVIRWGEVGVGYQGPAVMTAPKSADPAEIVAAHRARLLQRGDCFATRAEAEAAAIDQLHRRAAN